MACTYRSAYRSRSGAQRRMGGARRSSRGSEGERTHTPAPEVRTAGAGRRDTSGGGLQASLLARSGCEAPFGRMPGVQARALAVDTSRALVLYAQPIESLGEASSAGSRYELLLRIRNEDGSVDGPCGLISAVEQDGMGGMLDRFVLGTFLDWASSHRTHVDRLDKCFVNLTPDALLDPVWLSDLARTLRRSPAPVHKLCFEISERTPPQHLAAAAASMGELHALGCSFALDDFGKSNCSYQFLRAIPCDYLKIDGELVRGMAHSEVDRSIVVSITGLAHSLRKQVIAEGVENGVVQALLADIGVDYAQGFHLGTPRPIEAALVGLH